MPWDPNSSSSTFKVYNIEKGSAEWKKLLGPEKFKVLRMKETEKRCSSEYDQMYPEEGIFRCAGCRHPLYTAGSKFKSKCGWPCFDQVIFTEEHGCHVGVNAHKGNFEIVCNNCGGHLGHVFYGEGCTPKDERH